MDCLAMEDGRTVVCEAGSHNLLLLGADMKEQRRLEGKGEHNQGRKRSPRLGQPGGGKLLWLNSWSDLSIVDLGKFEAKEVPNFWTYNDKKCEGVYVTGTGDFKRFAGIGLSSDGSETLHVHDAAGGTGFSSTSVEKLLKGRLG